jgi:cytochrome c biogenesis protein CcdA
MLLYRLDGICLCVKVSAMTAALVSSIMGIALLDSLNPSLFLAQFYLLTTPKPAWRIVTYIAGILVVNFVGGLLIFGGLRQVVTLLFDNLDVTLGFGLQLLLGAAALGFGIFYKVVRSAPEEGKQPKSLHPAQTFVFGMVVMINELTTALPYFVAIERLTEANLPALGTVGMLALYNLVFALPLFGFLAAFLMLRQQFLTQINRISEWVQVWTPRLFKWAAVLFGAVLVANAAAYFITGQSLF